MVERNWRALALARESVEEVPLQPVNPHSANRPPVVSDAAPDFVKTVTAAMLAGLATPSRFGAAPDGTRPMGTTRWKNAISPKRSPSGKRNSVPNVTTVSPLPTLSYSRKVVPPEAMENALPACIRWM
ncbi:hypothetical protein DMI69_22900 [Escherichia coli]|nr:hypothetical protein [Escherichia coli]